MKNQNTTPAMKFNAIQTKNHAMQQKMTHEMQPADLTKSYIDQGLISRFSTWLITCVITLAKASMPVIAAGTMASSDAATLVSFTPSASGTTAAPIVGMSAAGDDYLLTSSGSTRRLAQDFTGNGQDYNAIPTPSTAKDAASFNTDYHFQLDTNNFIKQVSTTTGDANTNFNSLNVGGAFGIGYNASTDTLGVGVINGVNIDVQLYNTVSNLSGNTPSSTISFAFDQAQWGTPSGMDLVFAGGMYRILLGTHDGPGGFEGPNNYIFDIDGNTGTIDQYFTTAGSTNKLGDLTFNPLTGELALGYSRDDFDGRVERGFFSPIPEPSTAVLGGLGALGLAMRRKRTDKAATNPAL